MGALAVQLLAAPPNTRRARALTKTPNIIAVRDECHWLIRRRFHAMAASARLLARPIAAQPHVLLTRTSGRLAPSQRRLPRAPCTVEKGCAKEGLGCCCLHS